MGVESLLGDGKEGDLNNDEMIVRLQLYMDGRYYILLCIYCIYDGYG